MYVQISKIMKMENVSNGKSGRRRDYWFPLSKGYNRILIVIGSLIIIYVVPKYSQKINTFLFTLFIEIIVYIAIVWIYRGFKELPKSKDEEQIL